MTQLNFIKRNLFAYKNSRKAKRFNFLGVEIEWRRKGIQNLIENAKLNLCHFFNQTFVWVSISFDFLYLFFILNFIINLERLTKYFQRKFNFVIFTTQLQRQFSHHHNQVISSYYFCISHKGLQKFKKILLIKTCFYSQLNEKVFCKISFSHEKHHEDTWKKISNREGKKQKIRSLRLERLLNIFFIVEHLFYF